MTLIAFNLAVLLVCRVYIKSRRMATGGIDVCLVDETPWFASLSLWAIISSGKIITVIILGYLEKNREARDKGASAVKGFLYSQSQSGGD